MAKKTKKPEFASLPPEAREEQAKLTEGTEPAAESIVVEAPTEVTVVLSKEFRLNGRLYPAGRPVRVPADASHHMPVKTRL